MNSHRQLTTQDCATKAVQISNNKQNNLSVFMSTAVVPAASKFIIFSHSFASSDSHRDVHNEHQLDNA
jgi:hypothetical protein